MTLTQSGSPVATAADVRLPRDRVSGYDGPIVHTFGEGYNAEYARHMDDSGCAQVRHQDSVRCRALIAAFDSEHGPEWWLDDGKSRAAIDLLSTNLVQAVDLARGFFDRQEAEMQIIQNQLGTLNSRAKALAEVEEIVGTIFTDSSLTVLAKIHELVKGSSIDAVCKILKTSTTEIGTIKGAVVPRRQSFPAEVEEGYLSSTMRAYVSERMNPELLPPSDFKIDSARAQAITALYEWTSASRGVHGAEKSFLEHWHMIAPVMDQFLRDSRATMTAIETGIADAKKMLAEMSAAHEAHPCKGFFQRAVELAMENTSVKDIVTKKIPDATVQWAQSMYKEAHAPAKATRESRRRSREGSRGKGPSGQQDPL